MQGAEVLLMLHLYQLKINVLIREHLLINADMNNKSTFAYGCADTGDQMDLLSVS